MTEQKGVGCGCGRRRNVLANLPAATFEVSRLRPGRRRISHDFIKRAFVEPAAHCPIEGIGHLLPCEFFTRLHSQDGRRAGPEQRVACESQEHREERLTLGVGVPASPHDTEQWYLRVEGV